MQLHCFIHVILAYLFHDVCHVSNICGNEKGRPHNAPHTELSAVLCVCLSRTVLQWFVVSASLPTSVDEISIIPSTRTCVLLKCIRLLISECYIL